MAISFATLATIWLAYIVLRKYCDPEPVDQAELGLEEVDMGFPGVDGAFDRPVERSPGHEAAREQTCRSGKAP